MAAMSKPPTLASTSTGSAGSGRLQAIPRRMAATFRRSPSPVSPAPRPVRPSGSSRSSTEATALLVVVLPMPISPAASSRYPFSASSRASRYPAQRQASAWARLMAGPRVKSAVPSPCRRSKSPGQPGRVAIPISTGNTSAPAWAAILQTLVSPRVMFSATMAVTSCPVWVTPWATTPLSAQNTATPRGRRGQSGSPVTAQIFTTASSSSPRPWRGLAMESHRARLARSASRSGQRQLAAISAIVIIPQSSLSGTPGRPPKSAPPAPAAPQSGGGGTRRRGCGSASPRPSPGPPPYRR